MTFINFLSTNAWFLCLFLFILEDSIELIASSRTFTSHRLIQYEQNKHPLGSQSSEVDHEASPLLGSHDLGRNIAVCKLEDITLSLLKSLTDRRGQSLLVVMPNDLSKLTNEFTINFRDEIETFLLTNTFEFSIFFTFENEVTNDILNNVYSNTNPGNVLSIANGYHLKGSETSEFITGIQLTNLHGIMKATNPESKYILIAANHDSYGIVPTLSVGSNENGSGVNAIIQLATIFQNMNKLEINKNNSNKYGIIFLLTAGGYTNYEGTKQWLEKETFLIKNIEFVICLNSLANLHNSKNLYLHTTDDFEKENENKFYKIFNRIANIMNINLKINSKEVTEATNINSWHHETFSRKNMIAVTLSGKEHATPLNAATSILDTNDRISVETLERNIDFVGNVLISLIYGDASDFPSESTLNDNKKGLSSLNEWKSSHGYGINRGYMRNYVDFLGHTPRFGPYSFKSKYIAKLYDDLTRTCDETQFMKYKPHSGFEKFSSTYPISIEVSSTKPFLFDMIFLISTFSYLFGYFLLLKRPKNLQEFIALFAADN